MDNKRNEKSEVDKMSIDGFNIEDLIQKSLENHTEAPNSKVLKKIKRRLFWEDYFSLRLNKFNVGYTTILVAGLFVLLTNKKENHSNYNNPVNIIDKNDLESSDNSIKLNDSKIPLSESADKDKTRTIPMALARFSPSILSGCAPLTISFINNSLHAESYKWDFGTGENSTVKEPDYTFEDPGEYLVKLTVENKSGNNSHTTKIIVFNNPVADFDINIEASSVAKKTVVFTSKTQNAKILKWFYGDGTSSFTGINKHKYNKTGTYKVTLIASNEYGCSDTATLVNKFIDKEYMLSFPEVFRPNPIYRTNNGYYSTAENEQFVFYPKNNGANNYILEILTSDGHKVFKTEDIRQGWNGYIKGRLAPSGNYVYRSSGKYPNGKKFSFTGTFRLIADSYPDYY